jgi:hypothetical protein
MVSKIFINLRFSESRKLALQNNIELFSKFRLFKNFELCGDFKMAQNREKNEFLLKIIFIERLLK